jgi:hypothetical protein
LSDLLETVIEAHGGLERWGQLDAVSARLVQGGALWGLKGQQGGSDGLFRRHDYDVEISPGLNGAHYTSDYTQVAGITIPTRRRVFPRGPDGQALTSEPVTVSIDLSEIAFT